MDIVNLGHHHYHDDSFQICREHGSGNYLLLLVFTPAKMELNSETIVMTTPFFILYNINTPQIYGAYNDDYMDDWIHLTLSKRDISMLREMKIPMDTPIVLPDIDDLSKIIMDITYEFHANRHLKSENIKNYLRILFNRVGEHFHIENINQHYYEMSRIRGMIYNEPYKDYSIDTMAREVGLSRSSFQHIYKESFGISANADLINARVSYATELLVSTQYPIFKIAEMCGYHSDIHFMRQFKEQTGSTPTAYRKNKHII